MRLETPRLTLREYTEDDSAAVLAYQSDPRYLRYYPWEERTLEDVQRFVRTFIDWQPESPRRRFQLAVLLHETEALIGSCGVRRKPDDDTEADIGFELSPEHWGWVRNRGSNRDGGVCVPRVGRAPSLIVVYRGQRRFRPRAGEAGDVAGVQALRRRALQGPRLGHASLWHDPRTLGAGVGPTTV